MQLVCLLFFTVEMACRWRVSVCDQSSSIFSKWLKVVMSKLKCRFSSRLSELFYESVLLFCKEIKLPSGSHVILYVDLFFIGGCLHLIFTGKSLWQKCSSQYVSSASSPVLRCWVWHRSTVFFTVFVKFDLCAVSTMLLSLINLV